MRHQQINQVASRVLLVLSLIALVTVISGYFQPPQPDEGTGAHIFQLSIVAAALTILIFLTTADWQRPVRALRSLLLPAVVLAFSFSALYYLEHYFYLEHHR